MPSGSSRKRKVYGVVVRGFKEESDDGKDIHGDADSSFPMCNNASEDNDEEFSSTDQTRYHHSKKMESVISKRENKARLDTIKRDDEVISRGVRRKDAAIKAESFDDNGEKMIRRRKKTEMTDLDSFDVLLPLSTLKGGGSSSDNQCTLLVEVSNANDAVALGEFGGSIGAIGRFESDPKGITLDLKGNQYRGSLLPGPTCLIVSYPQSFGIKKIGPSTGGDRQQCEEEQNEEAGSGKLRVEGIADEYTTLIHVDDHMAKLDAVVIGDSQNHNT